MNRKTKLILSSFVVGILGFMISQSFINFSISFLNLDNITLATSSLRENFIECILFACSIGAIPFLLLFKDIILSKSTFSFKKDINSIVLILVAGLLAWQFRIFQINQNLHQISSNSINNDILSTFQFSKLNFSLYLMIGFFIGGVISVVLTKKCNH